MNVKQGWERVKTTPGLGKNVAAIGILIVGAIIAVSIMAPKMTQVLPFSDRQVVKAEFARVPGVNPDSSAKVTIAGVIVGQITGATATDRGTAILDLNIEGQYQVFENARAVLRPKNVLNDMVVELNPGGTPAGPLPRDGFIPLSQTERPIEVDEVLGNLDEKTQAAGATLLAQTDTILANAPQQLPAGLGATADALANVRPVLQSLDTRRDKIAKLVSNLSQLSQAVGKSDDRVARLVSSTQDTMAVLSSNSDNVTRSLNQLPGVNQALNRSMNAVQPLTREVDSTLDNVHKASDELPDALDRLKGTVGEVDKTVDSAKPFLDAAKPIVRDLRPFVDDAQAALKDLDPVTKSLKKDTATLVTYKTNIQAFFYNTRSVFGAGDGPDQATIRGHFVCRVPDCVATPGNAGGVAADEKAGN